MKFVNRNDEIKYIKETIKLSKTKLFTVSISGLRRVGKTRLILEVLKEKDLYFFVNKDKRSESLLKEYEEILKNRGILTELESLKGWEEFFGVLFKRFKGTIAFDEFQNFVNIDKSVFGILQNHIDLNEHAEGILFIFSGSLIGLSKKLFLDAREPLYGRVKRKFHLNPLSFCDVIKMCHELNLNDIEDTVCLYAIFGGFPKYYVSIEDENLKGATTKKIMERFFFVENATLEAEVSQILSLEFGKRSGLYYDILTAIANGNTRMSEISSFLRKKETALTRQMNELVNYFELVGVEKSITDGKGLLFIKHPLMNFWFRFFYKNISSYKRRERWLIEKIKMGTNAYVGKQFENVCREVLVKVPPFRFDKIGKWWGHYREGGERKTAEIDVVALNEETRQILFAECKWKKGVNAERILKELKEKAKRVEWHNEERKEQYAIFAKSFRKRTKEEGLMLFDLKDLERIFTTSTRRF